MGQYQKKNRHRDELLPEQYDYRTEENESRYSALDRIYNKTTGSMQDRAGTRRSLDDNYTFEGAYGNRKDWRTPEVKNQLLPDYDPVSDPDAKIRNVGTAPHTVGYCTHQPLAPAPKQTYNQWVPPGTRKKKGN